MPIPYSVTNPRKNYPFVTVCLILINIVLYVLMMASGRPAEVVHSFGFPVAGFSLIGLFTHQFLHGGIMHLVGNMWFLWLFGANLEDLMGRVGYIVYYLLGGVVAALAFRLVVSAAPGDPTRLIGASGAISAVMGGYFLLFPKSQVNCIFLLGWLPIPFKTPAVFFLGLYFIMQFTFMRLMHYANIAYAAHVGGFAFGAGVLYLLLATRAVIVPNRDHVARGEYALVSPEDEFLGRLKAAFEKQRFEAIPALYRNLLIHSPNVVFTPDVQMRVAQALLKGDDPEMAVDAYRRLMTAAPGHSLSHRAGIETAKVIMSVYRDRNAALAYLNWVLQATGAAGPLAVEARAIMQRLSSQQ